MGGRRQVAQAGVDGLVVVGGWSWAGYASKQGPICLRPGAAFAHQWRLRCGPLDQAGPPGPPRQLRQLAEACWGHGCSLNGLP